MKNKISANIISLRKSVGLSQDKFAEKLGIPTPTYAHYESGRNEPSISTLIKLADFFGCSVDYLLGHETKNILHLDSLTEQQRRAFDLMLKLDYDQTNILIGRLSEMLNLPYSEAKPTRPF